MSFHLTRWAWPLLLLLGHYLAPSCGGTLSSTSSVSEQRDVFNPVSAAAYLDDLFADHAAARVKLVGSFQKRSRVLVAYVCYERGDVIRSTLSYLLISEGLSDWDLLVSQDGGTDYIVDDDALHNTNSLYIRHPWNLCAGLHHYFVKRFAFDIMGYDALIVVEEDNTLHPQALQMLNNMLQLSSGDDEIGIVSITDMDNTLLVDSAHFNNAVLRTDVEQGQLWAYALNASRYQKIKGALNDFYNTIKGHQYRSKTVPPLRDALRSLYAQKGFPPSVPPSQDAYFIACLAKAGYRKRLTTLVRLFEPVGWTGMHGQQDPSVWYGTYGRGMYEGDIQGLPYDVTSNLDELAHLQKDCRARLDRIYLQYLGRKVDEPAAESAVMRLLRGRLNAVELVRNIVNSAEHRRRMEEWVANRVIVRRALQAVRKQRS